jgi:hypothetical protein
MEYVSENACMCVQQRRATASEQRVRYATNRHQRSATGYRYQQMTELAYRAEHQTVAALVPVTALVALAVDKYRMQGST